MPRINRVEPVSLRLHPDWPWPFNFHCMMMGRILLELQAEGFSAYMVYDDDPVAITGYDY